MGVFAQDGFSGSDGTALAGRTADGSGGAWTEHASVTGGDVVISDANRARATTVASMSLYHLGTPGDADQTAKATIRIVTATQCRIGVACRIQAGAATCYHFLYRMFVGWSLERIAAGVYTQLGSTAATPAFETASMSKVVEVRAIGDQISGYVDGVLTIGPITDANITTAGLGCGILYNGPNSATTNATGYHFDDVEFSDGTGGGATGGPRRRRYFTVAR